MQLELRYGGRLKFDFMARISTYAVKRLPFPNVAGEAAAGEWTDMDDRSGVQPRNQSSANARQRGHISSRIVP